MYQNVWNIMQGLLKAWFIALSAYINNWKDAIKSVITHWKALFKKRRKNTSRKSREI